MSVVEIQFDQQTYREVTRCTHWLKDQPDFAHLLSLKGFRLKTGRSERMSSEPRKVWYWTGDDWRYTQTRKIRPDSGILIVVRDMGDVFTESDVPPISNATQQKRREAERKLILKEKNAVQRKLLNKIKRQEAKEKKRAEKEALGELEEEEKEKKEKTSKKRKQLASSGKSHIVVKEEARKRKKTAAIKVKKDPELLEDSDEPMDIDMEKAAKKLVSSISGGPILKTIDAPKDLLPEAESSSVFTAT
jgi:flagellar biosynthesis GTPase FlhF